MSTNRKTVERVANELLDIAGIAEHLNLDKATVRTDVIRRPGFPEPIRSFGQSRVWWVGDVDAWNENGRRPRGRPKLLS